MRTVVMTIMLMLSIGMLSAQERGRFNFNPEEMAKTQAEHLEKELKLTALQKDSVYKWSLEQARQQQALFQNSGQNREGMREKMTALREKTGAKISAILDEDQKTKYAKIQKEAANRGPGGNRGGGRGPRN